MIDAEFILDTLKKAVEERKADFDPKFWIEAAHKLVLLLGDEQAKLFELQQKVAQLKLMWLEGQDKKNVSEAKLRVEATDEMKAMRNQEAMCKRIEEFIRISKKRSDVASGY